MGSRPGTPCYSIATSLPRPLYATNIENETKKSNTASSCEPGVLVHPRDVPCASNGQPRHRYEAVKWCSTVQQACERFQWSCCARLSGGTVQVPHAPNQNRLAPRLLWHFRYPGSNPISFGSTTHVNIAPASFVRTFRHSRKSVRLRSYL